MSGETVIYRNELNLVPLRNFTSVELDLFFAMCNKLKEQQTSTLYLSFDTLKDLSKYNHNQRNKKRFIEDLEHVYDKMLEITYRIETDDYIHRFVLFNQYKVFPKEEYLEISTHPDLIHLLNSLTEDFTKFELAEMCSLRSSYSKNIFRLLKQFKHTGYLKLKMTDFRERLDIPKAYKMGDIDKRVLKPIIKELVPLFPNLEINKIKAKKGRSIEYLEFTFDGEKRIHSKKQPYARKQKRKSPMVNREKTPKWLDNPNYQEATSKPDIDKSLEKDRERFLEQLKQNWDD